MKRSGAFVLIFYSFSLCYCDVVHADNIFLLGQTGIGGRIVSIDAKSIRFDIKCRNTVKVYKLSEYSGIHFNDSCGNKRVDAVGGDENGCPYDKNGDRTDIGAKKYVLVVTNKQRNYALFDVLFENNELRGKLLLSGKNVVIPRNELDAVSPQEDCDFKNIRNK